MFCPNCGANNTTNQNFCRSCGLGLEKISRTLLEQIPSAESAELLRRQKKIEKLGTLGFIGLANVGAFGVLALIYSVLVKMILSGTNIIGGVLLIAFMIFAVLTLMYVFYMKALEDKQKLLRLSKNPEVEDKTTGQLLEEKPFEPVPSITENTTDLLYAENKTRKLE
jgi:uncharacterized protein YacL